MKRNGLGTDGTTERKLCRDKCTMLKVDAGNRLYKLQEVSKSGISYRKMNLATSSVSVYLYLTQ